MKYYAFPEKRITRIAMAALVMILLVLARDTMITHSLVGMYVSYAITFAAFGLFGIAFLICNRANISEILRDKRFVMLLIISAILLLPMVVKQDWQFMYISIAIGSVFAVFLSYFVSSKDVAKYYVIWMVAFALYSLMAHSILRNLADDGVLPAEIFCKVREHYNFFFAFPTVYELRERDYGMFREPGVYQYFLLLALYLNNWSVKWKKKRNMWAINLVLAVSVIATQSTNGVVELALLTGILFFDKQLYKNKTIRAGFIAAMAAALGAVVYSIATESLLYGYLGAVFSKLFTRSHSLMARAESIFVNLDLFLKHPLFGAKIAEVLHVIQDNTSSTMIMFAAFGIAGGLLHIVSWIVLVWDKSRNVLLNLALVVTMFMSFNTQNLTWDVMFWLFPIMALTERIVPWLEKKLAN